MDRYGEFLRLYVKTWKSRTCGFVYFNLWTLWTQLPGIVNLDFDIRQIAELDFKLLPPFLLRALDIRFAFFGSGTPSLFRRIQLRLFRNRLRMLPEVLPPSLWPFFPVLSIAYGSRFALSGLIAVWGVSEAISRVFFSGGLLVLPDAVSSRTGDSTRPFFGA